MQMSCAFKKKTLFVSVIVLVDVYSLIIIIMEKQQCCTAWVVTLKDSGHYSGEHILHTAMEMYNDYNDAFLLP